MVTKVLVQIAAAARLTALLLVLSLAGTACSKKEEQQSAGSVKTAAAGGSSLLDAEVLSYLPEGTLGFYVLALDTPTAKKFREGRWGEWSKKQLKSSKDTLQSLASADPQTAKFLPFYDVIEELGIIGGAEPSIRQGVVFIGSAEAEPEFAGALALGGSGADMLALQNKVKGSLQGEGSVKAESISGATEAFSYDPPSPEVGAVYFAATKERLALASSQSLAAKLISGAKTEAITGIRNSDNFKRAVAKLPAVNQLNLAYVNIDNAVPLFNRLASPADAIPASEIPLESLAFVATFDASLNQTAAVTLRKDLSDATQKLVAALKAPAADLYKAMPADAALFFALDGAVISGLYDMAAAADPSLAGQVPGLDTLRSVKAVDLTIRPGDPSSPFPEIILGVSSSQAAAIAELIKAGIGAGLGQGGMPGAQWMQRDISGVKSDVLPTPLGVSVILASTESNLVLTTAEKGVSDRLGKGQPGKLPEAVGRVPHGNAAQIASYADMQRLASIVESFQGTMAMFTGGQPQQGDTAFIDGLKNSGNAAATFSFEEQAVVMRSASTLPAAS